MSCAEGWDPDRWDSLDIIQPTGQVIRTERSSSTRSSTATPVEKEQADEKVSTNTGNPCQCQAKSSDTYSAKTL